MSRSNTFRQLALLLALAATASVAQGPLDVRIALVIGNTGYAHVPRLDNAVKDAAAIAAALRSLGFTVEQVHDAGKPEMALALQKFERRLQGRQALGMLYYAGHGLQLDWRNYMLPVDARVLRAEDVASQAVDLSQVVNTFKTAGTRMNIVVLDACRDNPFTATSASGKGLAQMDAPPGTLLAYATQPGNVAEDGDEGSSNGPYARFLQLELRRPFARVEDVFKRVRFQVRQQTRGRQIPWESTSLEEDLVFNDGTQLAFKAEELERLAAEAKRRETELLRQAEVARDRERVLAASLESARQAAAAEASARERLRLLAQEQAQEQQRQRLLARALAETRQMEALRQQQAEQVAAQVRDIETLKGLPREEQRQRTFATEKSEWERARDASTAQDLYAYLVKYPNGAVTELAQARLEQIEKPQISPAADRTGLVQPFEARRFRLGDSYEFVVRDLLTRIETERPMFRVTQADAETAEFNQGYKVTQAGAIIRTIAGATLDPHQQWIPSGQYQVGQKWYTRSIITPRGGRPQWVELNGRVVARETITVPAGSFDTYRMEMEQTAQDGTRLKITYWGQPDWGVAVKQIREVRDTRGALSGQVYEMVSRKRGG